MLQPLVDISKEKHVWKYLQIAHQVAIFPYCDDFQRRAIPAASRCWQKKYIYIYYIYTLPETNIAPENGELILLRNELLLVRGTLVRIPSQAKPNQ